MSRLIDSLLEKEFKEIGMQLTNKNIRILTKFYAPWNNWSWYVAEYYPKYQVCYGYVSHEDRWIYFSLAQIENIQGPDGVQVQRDTYFGQCFFDIKKV